MTIDSIDQLKDDWTEQRPDLDAGPVGTVLRIQALAKILGDKTSDRLRDHDLEWWEYDVLATLRRQGEPFRMAATELADDNMLSSGAMTNRIDGLEARNLVIREPDPGDRRKVMVRLTRAGLDLIDKATGVRFDTAIEALEGLTTDQHRELDRLLRIMTLSQEIYQGQSEYTDPLR